MLKPRIIPGLTYYFNYYYSSIKRQSLQSIAVSHGPPSRRNRPCRQSSLVSFIKHKSSDAGRLVLTPLQNEHVADKGLLDNIALINNIILSIVLLD